jgi:type I restriction enzyme R subunit
MALKKAVAGLVRAYANLADELDRAGYSEADIARIKTRMQHYVDMREIVRNAANENLDIGVYEADMRHLIDTYIEAEEARKFSPFDNMSLLNPIVKSGIGEAIAQKLAGLKGNSTRSRRGCSPARQRIPRGR